MNTTPAPYCERCRFYHGANRVVCGLHPYGPESDHCSDFDQKATEPKQPQPSRRGWDIPQLHEWKNWQKIAMLGLLLGAFSSGYILSWGIIYPKGPKAEPNTGSESIQ